MRILIADDERTSRIILRKFLTDLGHDVEEADDGFSALRRLRDGADDTDLLVLDIMMPEMDGLTLLEIIRRRYPLLPVIMLTAKGERGFVKRALKLGASDFLDKPVKKDALRSAIREAVGNISQKTLVDSMQTSLAVREVQSQLLENSACEACAYVDSIHFWFRAFSDAGGDFFLCRSGGRFCQVVLADVAGHDVKSSYAVAELRGVLDGLGSRFEDPGELLKAVNRVFVTRSGASEKFICALCIFIDFERGEWRIANAGVPYPLIHRRSGGVAHWLRIGGNMLGVLDDPSFETAVVQMGPEDSVLAFSDGLEEILTHADVAERWSQAPDESLRVRLERFVEGGRLQNVELKDDILLLAMTQPPTAGVESRAAADLEMALEMPCRASQVEPMLERIVELKWLYFGVHIDEAELRAGVEALLQRAVCAHSDGGARLDLPVAISVNTRDGVLKVSVLSDASGFDSAIFQSVKRIVMEDRDECDCHD